MIDYNSLPPVIDQQQARNIVIKIKEKQSTTKDREDLINGYLRFAWSIGNKIAGRHGINRFNPLHEDIINTGMLELAIAVDRLIHKKSDKINDDFIKYLNKSISRRCQDTLRAIRQFGMPMRTLRFKLDKGINKKKQTIIEINDLPEAAKNIIALLPPMYQNEMKEIALTVPLDQLKKQVRSKLYQLISSRAICTIESDYRNDEVTSYVVPESERSEVNLELKEAFARSIFTLREQDIIRYRSQGMNYEEIGKLYSMSSVAVFHVVQRVQARFDEVWK